MIDLKNKSILSFFAHPDDETLAAGATLNRLIGEGCVVHVAIPNTGIHSRRNQANARERDKALAELRNDCNKALSLLGVEKENIHLGLFSDNEIDRHTLLELIYWVENILDKVKPDIIFTHHRYCTNIDHQYCHEAAVVAARPGVSKHIPIICGEVPSSTGYLKPTQWEPNLFVDVCDANLSAKIKAMQTYKGEARPDPHPRSPEVLRALAKVRGSESGFYFAEAFMVQNTYY
jgi:N-acetylglucosamine malate deacetylase 1